jgi:hypothetical protein
MSAKDIQNCLGILLLQSITKTSLLCTWNDKKKTNGVKNARPVHDTNFI